MDPWKLLAAAALIGGAAAVRWWRLPLLTDPHELEREPFPASAPRFDLDHAEPSLVAFLQSPSCR